MKLEETQLSTQSVFEGRLIRVRVDRIETPDGGESVREVVTHRTGGACVVAEDEQGRIAFVRQFRYAYGEVLLELPAGKLEPGEPAEICALRELTEETGMMTEKVHSMGLLYPSVGFLNETIHLFCAKGLTPGEQSLDEDEFMEVVWIDLDEAVQMVLRGEIPDAKTQLGVLKYAALRNSL